MHALPAITEAKDQITNITFDWVVDKNFSSVPKWHPDIENTIQGGGSNGGINLGDTGGGVNQPVSFQANA